MSRHVSGLVSGLGDPYLLFRELLAQLSKRNDCIFKAWWAFQGKQEGAEDAASASTLLESLDAPTSEQGMPLFPRVNDRASFLRSLNSSPNNQPFVHGASSKSDPGKGDTPGGCPRLYPSPGWAKVTEWRAGHTTRSYSLNPCFFNLTMTPKSQFL